MWFATPNHYENARMYSIEYSWISQKQQEIMIPKMLHSIIRNKIRGFESRMILINCCPKAFLNIWSPLKAVSITKNQGRARWWRYFCSKCGKIYSKSWLFTNFTYFHRYPKEFILAFLWWFWAVSCTWYPSIVVQRLSQTY